MTKERRSKFNVGSETEERSMNDIVFDSAMEKRYYEEIVLPGVESGEITSYELQKPYVLQPSFTRDGKQIKAIIYVADFYIEHKDGRVEVIDTKGFPDPKALMKRKMFWYLFPTLDYKWICYSKIDGGWCTYEEVQAGRRRRKKEKQLKLKLQQEQEENKSKEIKE